MVSETFCILPWVQLTGGYTGRSTGGWYTCFAAQDRIATTECSIQDAWNGPRMREIRLRMLKGDQIDQCRGCHSLEDAGAIGFRRWANLNWRRHIWKAAETGSDGSVDCPIVSFDVRFSNLCNFRCRMCGHALSSSWYGDAVELGIAGSTRVMDPWTKSDSFWYQVKEMVLPHVELIYFSGGEPLIQDAHYKMLDMLREYKRTDVRLHYSTNLSTLKYKGHDVLRIWEKFKDVSVFPSIDGVGKRGEYIRKGLVYDDWLENVKKLGSHMQGYSVAISVYNIYHHLELCSALQKKFPKIQEVALFVDDPKCLSIQIFPPEIKKQIESRHITFLEQNSQFPSSIRRNTTNLMKYMMSADESHLAKEFKQYTSKLDELRRESFSDTFPELAEWYEGI
jgi:sulfatase maturation enzyme AslB (radical SAM superfamily)